MTLFLLWCLISQEELCTVPHTMRMKALAPLLFLSLFAVNTAWAQVQMYTISVPTSIANPLGGFTINYTLGGSKYGVGAATAQLEFYLSTSRDGSTGVWLLSSQQIMLRGSGLGPYYPPTGTQSQYISRFSMASNTVAMLESIAAACRTESLYILGRVDYTAIQSKQSVLGTSELPDFYFTGGTMSPAVIGPGGSTNITFDLYTRCPTSNSSTVGIYLADANYTLIAYIGGVSIGAGSGTYSLPPTTITFSPYITPGGYHIVLFADDDGVVAESNENNNVGSFALDIAESSAPRASDSAASSLKFDVALPADAASKLYGSESGESHAYIKEF